MSTLGELLLPEDEDAIRKRYARGSDAWDAYADQSLEACHKSDSRHPSCGSLHFLGCGDCRSKGERAVAWADGCCRQAIKRALEDSARKRAMIDKFEQIIIEHYQKIKIVLLQ